MTTKTKVNQSVTNLKAIKGTVGNTPVFTTLQSKEVAEFSFYRYGKRYTAKAYSNKIANSLSRRIAAAIDKGQTVTLIKPDHSVKAYVNREGQAQIEEILIINHDWQIKF